MPGSANVNSQKYVRAVYLIRHELPKDWSGGYRWSLVGIKLENVSHAGASVLAFDTESEAASFASTLNPNFQYSVVRSDPVGLETFVTKDSYMLVAESHANFWSRNELGDLHKGPFVELPVRKGVYALIRRVKDWNAARILGGKVES